VKRIIIGGSIGAGKTSLAKLFSKKFDISHIELDALYWLPGWRLRPVEEFKKIVAEAIDKPSWVICGNFSVIRPITWKKADTVVWLDYPFFLCFWQCFKRSVQNVIKRRPCCNENYESFSRLFFSRHSILWWMIKTYKKRNKKYFRLMNDPEYKHITFIRLTSHEETKKWVESLDKSG